MNAKQRKKKKRELSVQHFARLSAIFAEKQWPIEDEFGDKAFDNFCNLLTGLEANQCELMLTLTEKFLWVRESEYIKLFSHSFGSFMSSFSFGEKKNIVVCPLLPENDFGKSKSSIALFYLIKSRLDSLKTKYSQYNIFLLDRPSSFKCEQLKNSTIVCLVDDFIGSGNTATEAANFFLKQDYPLSQIAIISLVAMEEGLDVLQKSGYNTYTSIVAEKGITGSGRDEPSETKTMQEIEFAINISPEFQFGYSHSEALVKMIRTPNNTFPIYWYKKENVNAFAPFPR